MKEEWKPINGFEKYYLISNFGRVRSLDREVKVGESNGKRKRSNYILKTKGGVLKNIKNGSGYVQVNLYVNGKSKIQNVHRLVAKHFIPNPFNKKQVNHKDGNKANPHINNLEWATVSENGLHGYRILGYKVWHKGKNGKNTPSYRPVIQYDLCGNKIKEWDCGLDAVRTGKYTSWGICRCCQGIIKTHRGFIWKYGEK